VVDHEMMAAICQKLEVAPELVAQADAKFPAPTPPTPPD
jgi:hypothetical protein